MKGAGHHGPPSGRRILPPLELPGPNDVREHGGSKDTDNQQNERMRKSESHEEP